MSLVKIPQIPAVAIGVDGTELIELVQGGVSKQAALGLIAALVNGAPGSIAEFIMVTPILTYPNARGLAGEATVISVTDGGPQADVTIGVDANGITNAKLAQVADQTVKANISGGVANPTDITLAQLLGAIYAPVVITAAGTYNVPNSALNVIINKTDGGNVQLGTIANKVGPVKITGQNADVHPFNVTVTNGNIMGALATYPFTQAYQSAIFYPYTAATTWLT